MGNREIWQAALGELELSISKANFMTWFKNTAIISYQNSEVTISVPNAFSKSWLETKYHRDIVKALTNVTKKPITKVIYKVGRNVEQINNAAPTPEMMTNITINTTVPMTAAVNQSATPTLTATLETNEIDSVSNLNPRHTFDNFVVGSSNELVSAACKAVAVNPGAAYNPLFIYGGVGLGKTHLLHAVGNEVIKRFPNKKVKYITSEKFTNEMINFIQKHRMNEFKNFYREIDVLILDDVQFLAGKEKTQEEFFHTFNALYEENKQIVLSSDRPPKAIPTLEDRLRSRFEGGMIADIGVPDFETRMAILNQKTQVKQVEIPQEIVEFIAMNIQNNVRELEGALNRIIAHSQLHGALPTIEQAKQILSHIINTPKRRAILPRQITEAVASFYNLSLDDLRGKSRKKETVVPRQIVMFLMREEIKSSYPAIGRELGGRDHTTAMHACQKIDNQCQKDEALQQEIELIRQKIYTM